MHLLPGISVVVCCYNSSDRLEETLAHLAGQKFRKKIPWEILLINNNSTDHTVDVATAFRNKLNNRICFKIVDEKLPGLTYARKKGVKEAQYDFIIFCDDDNWLHENYVCIAYELMNKEPNIGVLGGKIIPCFQDKKPLWFEACKEIYAVGEQSPQSGVITKKEYIWGAGMIVRRNLLLNVFDDKYPMQLDDRKKHTLSSGGDAEICLRIIMQGYDLYYDSSLQLTHFIPKERLTEAYCDKLQRGIDNANKYLAVYKRQIQINNLRNTEKLSLIIKTFIRILFSFTKKWQADFEMKTLYLITGLRLSSIAPEIKAVKAFSNRFKNHRIHP